MEFIQFRRNYSRHILLRMIVMSAILTALIVWKLDFILTIYFREQLTPTGLIINGSIVTLFILGMLRIIDTLFKYMREEKALQRFLRNLEANPDDLLVSVPVNTIIARRFHFMRKLYEQRAPINHATLASTLVAAESTRTSLPKFINNVLILTGVFGTIVSLSIALIGASDLLQSMVQAQGMGMIIHGMSTALSTTITAILCYFVFGYFYLKLADAQTNLVSAVEQVTAGSLIPRFHVQGDTLLYEFSGLIRSLQGLISQMELSQRGLENIERRMMDGVVDLYQNKLGLIFESMSEIQQLLREGFRLPGKR